MFEQLHNVLRVSLKDERVSYDAKLFYEIVFDVVQTAHHDS